MHRAHPVASAVVTRLLCVLALALCTSLTAQSASHSVSGHLQGKRGFNTFELSIGAVKLKSGAVRGRMIFVQTFDNGVNDPIVRKVNQAVDELHFVGNRAYIRAGKQYVVIEDNGATGDKFLGFFFVSTPPPLAAFIPLLSRAVSLSGLAATVGNASVR